MQAEVEQVNVLLREIGAGVAIDWSPLHPPDLRTIARNDEERAAVEHAEHANREHQHAAREVRTLERWLQDARDEDDGTAAALQDCEDLERRLAAARSAAERLAREADAADRQIVAVERRTAGWRESAVAARSRQIEAARAAFQQELNTLKFRMAAIQRAADLCPVLGDLLGRQR